VLSHSFVDNYVHRRASMHAQEELGWRRFSFPAYDAHSSRATSTLNNHKIKQTQNQQVIPHDYGHRHLHLIIEATQLIISLLQDNDRGFSCRPRFTIASEVVGRMPAKYSDIQQFYDKYRG